jgi:hypothetical protein
MALDQPTRCVLGLEQRTGLSGTEPVDHNPITPLFLENVRNELAHGRSGHTSGPMGSGRVAKQPVTERAGNPAYAEGPA